MMRFKKMVIPAAMIATLAMSASKPSFSFANGDAAAVDSAPVPVSAYVADDSPVIENMQDETIEETAQYLNEKHMAGNDDAEYVRIRNLNPAADAGKIIIIVHESETREKPEFLEVFRQKSADPADLDPMNLFDNGTSNRALVSTAGTFNGKKYVTPTGDFAIDSLEAMHHSKTYDNAAMPNSMFFNSGIAIHAAIGGEIPHLGQVASHGCVRTHPTTAKILFDLISKDGRNNAVVEVKPS